MANTFSQMYVHVVFAVQGRANIIMPDWKDRLNEYIAGIIRKKDQKPIIINNHKDHVHAFIRIKPTACVANLVRAIKNNSTNFINDNRLVNGKFR